MVCSGFSSSRSMFDGLRSGFVRIRTMSHMEWVKNHTSMNNSTFPMKKVQSQQKLSCNNLHSPDRQSLMFEPYRLMI